ncbi:MAG: hypothetical protein PHW18_05055 [Sulfuricurvum sp.]|uniref:hypothetical protein n=1 Tax=Sulfuricurvum sp. TaxID=2025608 RepID=UPI0026074BB0|nr:hypothetical protein [Sulfuricurvum sp.]MDD2828923.1 hypothetical protein [Sulfuricurvum sp.]MDD4948586.1 hypothetical protein [Sulfuricurvum sp.]
MLGEKVPMWLNELKKAIILKDYQLLESLITDIPSFESLEQMEEASYLLQNATNLMQNERSATLHSLKQLKSTIDFLKATENSEPSSLNLKL